MPQQSFTYTDPSGRKARLTVPPGYEPPGHLEVPKDDDMASIIFHLDQEPEDFFEDTAHSDGLPEAENLLRRAHLHMNAAKQLSQAPAFQGKKPKKDGKTEMEHMVITENLSLLAIAGYLKLIYEDGDI